MQVVPIAPEGFDAIFVYNQIKFWTPILAGSWVMFHAVEWVKSIRTKDIPALQDSINVLNTRVDDQTTKLVTELKEMRSDFRLFASPQFYQTPMLTGARAK